MCARYKASDSPTPSPMRGERCARTAPQAPMQARVQPTRSAQPYHDAPFAEPLPENEPEFPARLSSLTAPPRRSSAPPRRGEPYDAEPPAPAPLLDDAFGSPRPPRDYPLYTPLRAEENPINEFRRAPKPGLGCFGAIWKFICLPFNLILFFTRHLPTLVLWPIRLMISFGFVGLLLAGIIAVIYGIKAGRYDITQILHMPERTIVLDRKGNEIGTLHGENRRSIVQLNEEVPRWFIDALIIQEDRSFWKHGGVDIRGLGRAVAQVFKHHRTTQGASTLTMQLAKNTYNHRLRNFDAKLTEIALARRIESTYDKNTILLCYINRVFFGHTFLGLKAAARGYFDKEPRDLTLSECAMLAGIICSPNEFSPYRKLSAATIQRDKVLKLMFEHGSITRKQYRAALSEPIVCHKPELRGTDNYALDLARSEVDKVLTMLENADKRIKDQAIYEGGLTVHTTLDVDLQDDIMRAMDARLVSMLENTPRYPHQTRAQYLAARNALPADKRDTFRPRYVQAACAVIDNATGALIAVVGGRNSEESGLNRALQSRRQVGSVFKPLVYGTYFEHGGSPNSLLSDGRIVPGEIRGGKKWSPRNSDNRFTGMHPAAWGLLKSRNTMAVRAGNRAGLQNVVSSALMAGFPRPKTPPGPTIYLGTWEASALEVAAAYTVFANGGVRPTPHIIAAITDAEGHTLWQNKPGVRRVFNRHTAASVSSILQQITKPGGTAAGVQRLGFKSPCGGKTGTTNGYKNAWFCGFTSELTAAVWVGFDRPVKIAEKAYGGTLAVPLWVSAMQCAAARGYPMGAIRTEPAQSTRNSGLRLCRVSGQLANSGCEYEGKAYTETMTDTSKKLSVCPLHAELAEDPDTTDTAEDTAEDPDAMPDEDEDLAEEV